MPPHPTSTPPEPDRFQAVRARNRLISQVRASLRGTKLDIRERATTLAISNPGHPDNGRIYITYATADVSLRRPVWHYLGRLQRHNSDDDPEAEPKVDTAAIIAALTSPPDTPTEAAEVSIQARASQQPSPGRAQNLEGP
jgi:hypothetical protein